MSFGINENRRVTTSDETKDDNAQSYSFPIEYLTSYIYLIPYNFNLTTLWSRISGSVRRHKGACSNTLQSHERTDGQADRGWLILKAFFYNPGTWRSSVSALLRAFITTASVCHNLVHLSVNLTSTSPTFFFLQLLVWKKKSEFRKKRRSSQDQVWEPVQSLRFEAPKSGIGNRNR